MGFFKDFKDDFSQAINELLPGDDYTEADEVEVNTLDNELDVAQELSKLDGLLEQVEKKSVQTTAPEEVSQPDVPELAPLDEVDQEVWGAPEPITGSDNGKERKASAFEPEMSRSGMETETDFQGGNIQKINEWETKKAQTPKPEVKEPEPERPGTINFGAETLDLNHSEQEPVFNQKGFEQSEFGGLELEKPTELEDTENFDEDEIELDEIPEIHEVLEAQKNSAAEAAVTPQPTKMADETEAELEKALSAELQLDRMKQEMQRHDILQKEQQQKEVLRRQELQQQKAKKEMKSADSSAATKQPKMTKNEAIKEEHKMDTMTSGNTKETTAAETLAAMAETTTAAASTVPAPGVGNSEVTDEVSMITAGTKIKGNMEATGSFEIEGTIEGDIKCNGKLTVIGTVVGNSSSSEFFADSAHVEGEVVSSGTVKVGLGSVIIGNITATSAVIAGAVKGDIDVQGPVVVDTSAVIMGNIKSRSVQINNGAVIEGFCSQSYSDVDVESLFSKK